MALIIQNPASLDPPWADSATRQRGLTRLLARSRGHSRRTSLIRNITACSSPTDRTESGKHTESARHVGAGFGESSGGGSMSHGTSGLGEITSGPCEIRGGGPTLSGMRGGGGVTLNSGPAFVPRAAPIPLNHQFEPGKSPVPNPVETSMHVQTDDQRWLDA